MAHVATSSRSDDRLTGGHASWLRRVLAAVAVAAFILPATNAGRAQDVPPRSVGDFRTAWYDHVAGINNLPSIRSEGMNTVVGYSAAGADVLAYLDKARESGVQVYLEIDRAIVRAGDEVAIRNFVAQYEAHPALQAWYLADEPSINASLGPLSVATAERLYEAIKAEDPSHPVAIAFSSAPSDDMTAYENAFDIAMWDEYPARINQAEFTNMDGWARRLFERAELSADKQGWIPIIQAFTTGTSGPSRYYRLPTNGEARYMTYAAVQTGATGIAYWARYRSTWTFLTYVLKPLVAELNRLGPALKAGEVTGVATLVPGTPAVHATTYRDPTSGRYMTIVVNHGPTAAESTLLILTNLGLTLATLVGGDAMPIDSGSLVVPLAPYEARTYDLS